MADGYTAVSGATGVVAAEGGAPSGDVAAEGTPGGEGAGGFVAVAPGTYSPPSAPAEVAPAAPAPTPEQEALEEYGYVPAEAPAPTEVEMTPAEALEDIGYVPAEAPPPPGVKIVAPEPVPEEGAPLTQTEHEKAVKDIEEEIKETAPPLYSKEWGKLGIKPSAGKYALIQLEHQMRKAAGLYPYGPQPLITTGEEASRAAEMARKALKKPFDPGMSIEEAKDYLFISPHKFESYKGVGEGQRVKTSIGEFYMEESGRIFGGGGQGEITPTTIEVDDKPVVLSQKELRTLKTLPTTLVDNKEVYDIEKIADSPELLGAYERIQPGFSAIAPYIEKGGLIKPEIVQAFPLTMLTTYGITKAWYDSTKKALKEQAEHKALESSLRPYIKVHGAPAYEVAGGYDLSRIVEEKPISRPEMVGLFGVGAVRQAEVYNKVSPYMVGGMTTPYALSRAMEKEGLTGEELRDAGLSAELVTLAEKYVGKPPPQEEFLAEWEREHPSPYTLSAVEKLRKTDIYWTEDKEMAIKPAQAAYYAEAKAEFERLYGAGTYEKAAGTKVATWFFAPARALEPTVKWSDITPLEHIIGVGQVALWTLPAWAPVAGRVATSALGRIPGLSRVIPKPTVVSALASEAKFAGAELKRAQGAFIKVGIESPQYARFASALQQAQARSLAADLKLTETVRAVKAITSAELKAIEKAGFRGARSGIYNVSKAHDKLVGAWEIVDKYKIGTPRYVKALDDVASARAALDKAVLRLNSILAPRYTPTPSPPEFKGLRMEFKPTGIRAIPQPPEEIIVPLRPGQPRGGLAVKELVEIKPKIEPVHRLTLKPIYAEPKVVPKESVFPGIRVKTAAVRAPVVAPTTYSPLAREWVLMTEKAREKALAELEEEATVWAVSPYTGPLVSTTIEAVSPAPSTIPYPGEVPAVSPTVMPLVAPAPAVTPLPASKILGAPAFAPTPAPISVPTPIPTPTPVTVSAPILTIPAPPAPVPWRIIGEPWKPILFPPPIPKLPPLPSGRGTDRRRARQLFTKMFGTLPGLRVYMPAPYLKGKVELTPWGIRKIHKITEPRRIAAGARETMGELTFPLVNKTKRKARRKTISYEGIQPETLARSIGMWK